MADKLRVGILGVTGAVGQNYALLLKDHPWFDITYLAASPKSAGKPFAEAVEGKWFMDRDIPRGLVDWVLGDASKVNDALGRCDFVFSSYEGSKEEIQATEMAYAKAGIPVVSNNSAHRWTDDVPMIIPEINARHLEIIPVQQKSRGFEKGFVVTKPNCSIQSFLTPVYALMEQGHEPKKIIVTTLQATSGAGYSPGVRHGQIDDNVIPYIEGEEQKTEKEPQKIFGFIKDGKIGEYNGNFGFLDISATCTRVPVLDGHTASVTLEFHHSQPELENVIKIWKNFSAEPQRLYLPSAPHPAIIYREEKNRPQPRLDRMAENGMAVSVGRLRYDEVGMLKFVGLSHNTIRGAAGGAILTAELLRAKGYL